MARPIKNGLDFPKWNPQRCTVSKFSISDDKIRLNAIRNSSSAFIKRKDVRRIILDRDGNCCLMCGSKTNLTIDHIMSIWRAFNGFISLEYLNSKDNLQALCRSCNSKKLP